MTDDNLALNYREYAPGFDYLCEINPAYQSLLSLLENTVPDLNLPEDPCLLDFGAGTGNFVLKFIDSFPGAKATHVDFNSEMNEIAREKYSRQDCAVSIVEDFMQNVEFQDETFDMIICVNALNNAPPAKPLLEKMFRWTKPNGKLFLVDFGREIDVRDWVWYLTKNSLRQFGLIKTIQNLYENSAAIRQNQKGKGDQQAGRLWTHDSRTLNELVERCGYTILESHPCYRDYADFVLAEKSKER